MSVNQPNANQSTQKQEIATLGDGKVFIRRTAGGMIQSVKGVITLKEKNGEIAGISGKYMTTAKGFNSLNQIAGLSIITPEKLQLPDGKIVVNPFPIPDRESGSIAQVWVRKAAIGYSPIGNLVLTSATLLYDIRMYFVQDVVKKVKDSKNAGRICLESQLTDKEKTSGIFLKIDGVLGVYASYDNAEILKAIETFINKKLFAERNAQSICERLVMSKHPALAKAAYVDVAGLEKNHYAQVPVVGYVNELSREQMMDIVDQAQKGETDIKVNGQTAEVIETTGTASYEEMATELDPEEEVHQAAAATGETNAGGGLFETGDGSL